MMRVSIFLLLACAACLIGSTASAAVFITDSNVPGNPAYLVHGTNSGFGHGPLTTVTGSLGAHGSLLLDATSTVNLVYDGGAGQATLVASNQADGSPSFLFGATGVTFKANAATPFGFTEFELNPTASVNGQIQIDVYLSDLSSVLGTLLPLSGNGNNRINIYTTAGEVITSIVATTVGGNNFEDIKQVRLGALVTPGGDPIPDPVPSPVPEPASMLVWTLAGITGMAYRYRAARRAA